MSLQRSSVRLGRMPLLCAFVVQRCEAWAWAVVPLRCPAARCVAVCALELGWWCRWRALQGVPRQCPQESFCYCYLGSMLA